MARAVAHIPFDKKSLAQSAALATTAAQSASRDLSGRAAGHGGGYPLGEPDQPAKSGPGRESADYPEPRFGYDLGRVCIHGGGPRGRRPPPRERLIETGLDSPSQPLPADLRRDYSARLGTELDDVRVHTGGRAEAAATLLGARAFTLGNHLVFGPGRFAPAHPEGRRLLTHELSHVAQQRRDGPVAPSAQTETEAKTMEAAPLSKVTPPRLAAAGPQFDPLSEAEIARLRAEGALDQLVARLQENEQETLQLVHSPDYDAELQRENLSLQRAIMAMRQQQPTTSQPPPLPDPLVAIEPRLTAESLRSIDAHRLEQLWVRVNGWLQAHLTPANQPADTPEYRRIAGLAQRISDEQTRRTADTRTAREQWEHDFALSQRTPGLLGLLLPAHTRPYYRDPTSEIRDPMLRLSAGVDTQAFYGAANLGRDVTATAMGITGAVMIVAAGGVTLAATLSFATDVAAGTATGARMICFVYTNAQSITALTEFTADQVFQIAAAGGIGAYLAGLQTPEGALNLGLSVFHLHISLGGGGGGPRRTATATAQIESVEGETITARIVSPPSLEGGEGEAPAPPPTTGGSRTALPARVVTPESEGSGGETASPPSSVTARTADPVPPSPAASDADTTPPTPVPTVTRLPPSPRPREGITAQPTTPPRRTTLGIDVEEDIADDSISPRRTPGGASSPRAAEIGNFAHTHAEDLEQFADDIVPGRVPRGLESEVSVQMRNGDILRIDRLDRPNGIVYEIKPDTPYWRRAGLVQARTYAQRLDEIEPLPDGRRWQVRLITYNMAELERYLVRIGYLEPL